MNFWISDLSSPWCSNAIIDLIMDLDGCAIQFTIRSQVKTKGYMFEQYISQQV